MPVDFGEDLSGEAGLERIAAIARALATAPDLDTTLQRIVDLARGYVKHCDGATLMLISEGRVITPVSSGDGTDVLDRAQYDTDEGPCLTAMRDHEVVVIDDVTTEDRWPTWGERVARLGWHSMLGLRLFLAEDTMGTLNLYSRRPAAFDRHSQALAQVFASHASVAMKAAISTGGLERALASRDVIGQAKGVLMERERLSGEQAFGRLRQLSSQHNVRLRELAETIAETGEIPG